jgi:hypothetical protein
MSQANDSALQLVERIKRKAPEYLDLLTATTELEFEMAFDAILAKAVTHLEKNAKNFNDLDEEGISGVLAGTLSIPGLTVTQETYSNGHADLTIEADHCTPPRTKLGEAKIYYSPSYHLEGLKQLLGYTTGKETRGLVLAYFKKKNIIGLLKSLRETMDQNLPEEQVGPTTDHTLPCSFISTHKHPCGKALQVSHIGCNLYVP